MIGLRQLPTPQLPTPKRTPNAQFPVPKLGTVSWALRVRLGMGVGSWALELSSDREADGTACSEHEPGVRARVVRVVEQVAGDAAKLEVPAETPAAAGVEQRSARRGNLARTGAVVLSIEGEPCLGVSPISKELASHERQAVGRQVVQIRIIVQQRPAGDVRRDLE